MSIFVNSIQINTLIPVVCVSKFWALSVNFDYSNTSTNNDLQLFIHEVRYGNFVYNFCLIVFLYCQLNRHIEQFSRPPATVLRDVKGSAFIIFNNIIINNNK